nr:cytochrome P450 [Streptomyces sp. NRRL F-2890]
MSGPRFQTEPAELYREMRRDHGALAPVTLAGDVPAWLALGYRELHQIYSDPVLFSRDSRHWRLWDTIPANWPLRPMVDHSFDSVLWTTGERHSQRIAMTENALEGVDGFELRRTAEEIADRLIDAFCGQGEAELISQYATLLPALTLVRACGYQDDEGPGLAHSINEFLNGTEESLKAFRHFHAATYALVDARQQAASADIASRMLAHGGYGREEIVQDLAVIIVSGQQPTADWIGNSLRLMLTDDRFAASLTGGRHSVNEAMNEVLWEDAPLQNSVARFATRDVQLGGQHIRAGDMVIMGIASAHHDPQIRTGGTSFTGGNNANFAFGHGDHRCPYPAQEIGETIARTGIEVLLDRLPDVELSIPEAALVWRPSVWMRGLTALPVRFTPAPAARSIR